MYNKLKLFEPFLNVTNETGGKNNFFYGINWNPTIQVISNTIVRRNIIKYPSNHKQYNDGGDWDRHANEHGQPPFQCDRVYQREQQRANVVEDVRR